MNILVLAFQGLLLLLLALVILVLILVARMYLPGYIYVLVALFYYPNVPRHPNYKPNLSVFVPRTEFGNRREDTPRDKNGVWEKFLLRFIPGRRMEAHFQITDPDLAKQLLIKENLPKNLSSYTALEQLIGKGLVSLQTGSEWRHRRRLLTPLFFFNTLARMVPLMNDVSERCLKKLAEKIDKNGGKYELVPREESTVITQNMIIALIFGGEFDQEWFGESYGNLLKTFRSYMLSKFALGPFAGLLPYARKFECTRSQIRDKLKEFIEKRKVQVDNNELSDDSADLVALMLKDNGDGRLSDDTILAESLTFFFAGYDTTANLFSWILYYLSRYPDIQEKCRMEIESVVGDANTITKDNITKMEYVKAFIKETLRMSPPVTIIPRKTTKPMNIAGHSIPANTPISVSFYAMLRHQLHWDKPNTFKPERFMNGSSSEKQSKFCFAPFSAGVRNCIGQKLAMMEISILVATFLRKFKIVKPSGQNEDPTDARKVFYGSILTEPNPNLTVILKHRSKA